MVRWTHQSLARNEVSAAFEPLQPFFLAALAKRLGCSTFIDIGANVGLYSLLFAEVEAIGRIDAFEPAPDSFAHLTRNIQLNGLGEKIIPHQVALSDREGRANFGVVSSLSGKNSIAETSIHSRFNSEIEVRTARLDDTLHLSGQTLCIKLDVEGHEPAVIAGMAQTLRQNRIVLQVEEWGDHNLAGLLTGLNPVCRIGHDCYFANLPCAAPTVVAAFEEASERMIQANYLALEDAPVRLRLPGGVGLRLNGRLAKMARSVKRSLSA